MLTSLTGQATSSIPGLKHAETPDSTIYKCLDA